MEHRQCGLSICTFHLGFSLGEIVTPEVPFSDQVPPGTAPHARGVGLPAAPFIIIGDYFYVYAKDRPSYEQPLIFLTVARARVQDVVAAANERNTVVPWFKYNNGDWQEPGLGGQASPLEADNAPMRQLDIAYNDYLGKYVAAVTAASGPDRDTVYLMESPDGLTWSNRRVIDEGPFGKNYPTIIGTGDDPKVIGRQFYVYYPVRSHQESENFLVRRLVSCEPGIRAHSVLSVQLGGSQSLVGTLKPESTEGHRGRREDSVQMGGGIATGEMAGLHRGRLVPRRSAESQRSHSVARMRTKEGTVISLQGWPWRRRGGLVHKGAAMRGMAGGLRRAGNCLGGPRVALSLRVSRGSAVRVSLQDGSRRRWPLSGMARSREPWLASELGFPSRAKAGEDAGLRLGAPSGDNNHWSSSPYGGERSQSSRLRAFGGLAIRSGFTRPMRSCPGGPGCVRHHLVPPAMVAPLVAKRPVGMWFSPATLRSFRYTAYRMLSISPLHAERGDSGSSLQNRTASRPSGSSRSVMHQAVDSCRLTGCKRATLGTPGRGLHLSGR